MIIIIFILDVCGGPGYSSTQCLFKPGIRKYEVLCAIQYHLYNLKNGKNTHALACNLTKSNTSPWVFFPFFKLCRWYQIARCITSRMLDSYRILSYKPKWHSNWMLMNIFNLFFVNVLFLYFLKTSEKQKTLCYLRSLIPTHTSFLDARC